MAWITFVAKTPEGDTLRSSVVTVLGEYGEINVQDVFSFSPQGMFLRIVDLPVGQYYISARADGYRFTPLDPFEVTSGIQAQHQDISDPFVFELQGTSSAPAGQALPCVVTGHVPMPSPSSVPGRKMEENAVPVRGGPNIAVDLHARAVTFIQVGDAAPGSIRALTETNRSRVLFDRNGYFEAELVPDTVYRVEVPTVRGSRYFISPPSGDVSELDPLIDAARTLPISQLLEQT